MQWQMVDESNWDQTFPFALLSEHRAGCVASKIPPWKYGPHFIQVLSSQPKRYYQAHWIKRVILKQSYIYLVSKNLRPLLASFATLLRPVMFFAVYCSRFRYCSWIFKNVSFLDFLGGITSLYMDPRKGLLLLASWYHKRVTPKM